MILLAMAFLFIGTSVWLGAWLLAEHVKREDDKILEQPPPKRRGDGLRKCRACGAMYHPSWGWICQNCSGAD